MTDARAKLLLRAAALFNILGAGSILALPNFSFGLLYGITLGPADGLLRTYHLLLFGFVVAMGVGLWSSAGDARQSRGILIASIMGKTLAATVWLRMVAMGEGTLLLALAALADLAWAIAFVILLRRQADQTAGS